MRGRLGAGKTEGMILTEELLLLAIDPQRGTIVNGAKSNLKVGLAGAAVAALALDGRADLSEKRFVAIGPPPEHPVLRDVHRELGSTRGRRAKDQLRRLDKAVGGLWQRTFDGLVEQRILQERRETVLLVPVTRHPVGDHATWQRLVGELRDAARSDGTLDPRVAVLLSLAGPCRLLEVVAPERSERGHAKRRIAEATESTAVAPVVKKVIQEAQAAVTAAVVASSVAATSSGS
jgi:Golgi phosphoprotein 3 GPP34